MLAPTPESDDARRPGTVPRVREDAPPTSPVDFTMVLPRGERLCARPRQRRRAIGSSILDLADFTLDERGRILAWGSAAERLYGYRPEEIKGRGLAVLFPGNGEEAWRQLAAARRYGRWEGACLRLGKRGGLIRVRVRLVWRPARLGRAAFAEMDMPEAREELPAPAVERLVESTAHELRTPLGVVLGAIALVPRAGDADGQMIELAQRELRHMDEILTGMLEAFRARRATLPVHPQLCDLRDVVQAAVQPLAAVWADHVTVVAPPHPLAVQADPARIEQVVRNLVVNAVRYSPSRAPVVVRSEAVSGRARVSVEDCGIGIAAEDLERIFEPSFRGSRQPDRGLDGYGVGLAVCRSVLEEHGGRIWAEQRDLAGACLRFELPLAPPGGEPA